MRKGRERTELADGGGAPEDEGGITSVVGLATLLVQRDEADRRPVEMVIPHVGRHSHQSERNARSLTKRDVLGDLHATRRITLTLGQTGTSTLTRSNIDITPRTFVVISTGTVAYYWNVALSFVNQP